MATLEQNSFALTTIATGLENPNGLSFGSDGALYVVETGRGGEGPRIEAPELGVLLSYGQTGAVTRIQNGSQEQIISGLPSFGFFETATAEFRSQALGPHDLAFNEQGNLYVLMGYGSIPALREDLGDLGADFGRLLEFDLNEGGAGQRLADFTAYEGTFNPDGEDIISNPFSLVVEDDQILVTDPGANILLFVEDNGTDIAAQTIFPSRPVGNFLMQSVPTSVTVGPDGAYYVGELTGVPYPEDLARVYRVEAPGAEPTIYADGFTQIADLAFDEAGNLYILEYSVDSLFEFNPLGALIQVTPDGTRTTISGSELLYPSEITLEDGSIYVSVQGVEPGEGQILRYTPSAQVSVPEPGAEGFAVLFLLCFIGFLKDKLASFLPGGRTTPKS